jgi:hypothetical protein
MQTQKQTQRIRPVMSVDEFKGLLNSMPKEELNEALKPGTPVGAEVRRYFVSEFISTRRLARDNAATRSANSDSSRELRRLIAKIERREDAAWKADELLHYRRLLNKSTAMAASIREQSISIGKSLETCAAVMDVFFERSFILDLLNVGRDVKEWINARERPFPMAELLSTGFADENERTKLKREIEPMMWCVSRYRGSQRAPVEAKTVEAAPEEIEALRVKLEKCRAKAATLVVEIQDESDASEPKRNKKVASDAWLKRRGEAIESVIATWAEIQPVLIGEGRDFSLAQKLEVLEADPAKVEKRDIPDGVSLLELVCALDVERAFNGETFGVFVALAAMANHDELRNQLAMCHAWAAGDRDRLTAIAGEMFGIENLVAHPTLQ